MSADTFTAPQLAVCRSDSLRPLVFRWLRGFLRWCAQGLAFGIGLGCLLAIVLRLTWKDSSAELAPFFYATPLPLVWIGLAVTGFLYFTLRKRRSALIAGLCAIACWTWWLQASSAAAMNETPPVAVRVVFWNIARLQAGWSPLTRQIQAMDSPIMGFVEAGEDAPADRQRWEQAFPKHQRIFFGNGMVLLVQGRVLHTEQGQLAKACYYGRADFVIAGETLTVFVVDINSDPFFCREQALAELHEVTRHASSDTVLVMGDFNTPADSVHLRALRDDFHNALEVVGQGTDETWPTPFPVLAIDQIWVNRAEVLKRAGKDWSIYSDHRAVIAELAFSE